MTPSRSLSVVPGQRLQSAADAVCSERGGDGWCDGRRQGRAGSQHRGQRAPEPDGVFPQAILLRFSDASAGLLSHEGDFVFLLKHDGPSPRRGAGDAAKPCVSCGLPSALSQAESPGGSVTDPEGNSPVLHR